MIKKLLSLLVILSVLCSFITTNADSWTTLSASTWGIYWASSAVYNNRLYVVWGYNAWYISELKYYSESNNTWTNNVSTLPAPRRSMASAIIWDKIYLFWGWWGYSSDLTRVDIYNITNNSWSTWTNIPTGRINGRAVAVWSLIYVIWGNNAPWTPNSSVDIYNTTNNSWSTWASLPVALTTWVALYDNWKIYYIWWSNNSSWDTVNTTYIYNISNNSWSTWATITTALASSAGEVMNWKIYIFWWYNNSWNVVSNTYIYNISNNSWSTWTNMPFPLGESVSWILNNKFYIHSWHNNTGWTNYLFYMVSNTTPTISNLTVPTYINSSNVSSTPFTIVWITDTDSGQTLTYKYSWDNSTWVDIWTESTPKNNSNYNFNLNTSSRPQGNNILYVKVNDGVSDSNIISNITITKDTVLPTLAQVTAVTNPTNDTTPNYTFSSNEAWTITYWGSCSSSTTSAISGNNTITFNSLAEGTYSNCTITVTDVAWNTSSSLWVSSFIVDTTAPVSPTSLLINSWALFTNNATVNLQITHPNQGDVFQWCVSSTNSYSSCSWWSKPSTTNINN